MYSTVTLHDISSKHLAGPVPYAVLAPAGDDPLPLCILLLGFGGAREALFSLQGFFEEGWRSRQVPPMVIATPTPRSDYYIEEPDGSARWESFLADDFVPHLRTQAKVNDVTVLAGISGGGYGALKTGFRRCDVFSAVAAMQPMLEPGLRESDAGARNRLHHSAGGPPGLIGATRDASMWEANNPATVAYAQAQRIRDSALAIYLEAGDADFLNAHDGAEFLHRTLWDLDLSHEYHLVRGADHGGPTMLPRLRAMLAWFGSVWNPARASEETEQAAQRWVDGGMQGAPPDGATTTDAFIQSLRKGFEPLRAKAAETDPTTRRRYAKL